jgi:DNA protecting protein DprA
VKSTLKADNEADVITALSFVSLTNVARLQILERVREEGSFESVATLLTARQRDVGSRIYDECRQGHIEVRSILDPRYPKALRYTEGAPLLLFVLGGKPDVVIPDNAIGVVGTRAASVHVCRHASEISSELASVGFTIVSGLALGIDGAAHRGSLEHAIDCPTVAVLAHGLDRVYPSSHQSLAAQIVAAGGLLISEYPPGTEPLKHHFLARNRIIAGLSRGVVIVQAGARSGSLVTAQFAADFGRDVFIVSPEKGDDRHAGGEVMLEQGAIEIIGARDVLREYGIQFDAPKDVEVTIEEALALFGLTHVDLLSREIRGEVVRLQGNRVRIRQSSVLGS